mgnify:CR=1 FL=1
MAGQLFHSCILIAKHEHPLEMCRQDGTAGLCKVQSTAGLHKTIVHRNRK